MLQLNTPTKVGYKFYNDDNKVLTGVTRYLNQVLFPEFNQLETALRIAGDIEGANLLIAEWEAKGKAAREEGIALHSFAEKRLSGEEIEAKTKKETHLSKFLEEEFKEGDEVYTEYPIYCNDLSFSVGDRSLFLPFTVGIPDIIRVRGDKVTIYDLKRVDGDITLSYSKKLIGCDVADSKLNRYFAQLLAYKAILTSNGSVDESNVELIVVTVSDYGYTTFTYQDFCR